MKIQVPKILAALVLTPLLAIAADEPKPAKASDGVKEPKTMPAGTKKGAPDATKEAGKSSDGVTEVRATTSKFSGKVTAVDESAKTVTIEDKKGASHTIMIGDSTELKKGKDDAKLSDLKVGAMVKGTQAKEGESAKAETLTIAK